MSTLKYCVLLVWLVGTTFCHGQYPSPDSYLQNMVDSTEVLLQSDPAASLKWATQSIALAQANNNSELLAKSWKLHGTSHLFSGNYPDAKASYEQALSVYASIQDLDGVWACQNNLAIVYFDTGELDLALQYHLKAYEAAKSAKNDRNLATTLNNWGNVRSDLKDYAGALENYREALPLTRKTGNIKGQAQSLTGCGGVHTELGNRDSTLYYNLKALPLLDSLGDPRHTTPTLLSLATYYGEEGNFAEANRYLEMAKTYLAFVSPRVTVHYYTVHGLISQMQQQHRTALASFEHAAQLAEEFDLAYQANWLRLYRARSLKASGEMSAAFDTLYQYATEQQRMTQLNSEAYLQNIEKRFKAQHERDSIGHLQIATQLKNEAQSAELTASRFRMWLFVVIGGMIISLLIFVLIFMRLRHQQSKTRAEAKRIELENRLLRSQMTPHFLYNSMNAIQQFIGENDTFQAEVYLSKFANLMRANLKHSRQERIPLEDELRALEDYIHLEKLRFREKFDYKIHYPEDLDLEMIYVPPMLIQPHVENAIIHGLSLSPVGGKLSIHIVEKENALWVTISDNGVGRDASKAVQEFNKQHPSLAIEITEERIAHLNQEAGKRGFSQVIRDLYGENGDAAGTQVVLQYLI